MSEFDSIWFDLFIYGSTVILMINILVFLNGNARPQAGRKELS
jgi:hypothetical protein